MSLEETAEAIDKVKEIDGLEWGYHSYQVIPEDQLKTLERKVLTVISRIVGVKEREILHYDIDTGIGMFNLRGQSYAVRLCLSYSGRPGSEIAKNGFRLARLCMQDLSEEPLVLLMRVENSEKEAYELRVFDITDATKVKEAGEKTIEKARRYTKKLIELLE